MITARLTGCTFAVRAGLAGVVQVTHQQPNPGVYDGLRVNQELAAIAGVRAYGRSDYDFAHRAVNVVGVRDRKVERLWPA